MYNEEVVKTADLQAHNVCRSTVLASLDPGQMSNFSFGSQAKTFGNYCLIVDYSWATGGPGPHATPTFT